MFNADLHHLIQAEPTYHERAEDKGGPWVTLRLYDDTGNNVVVHIDTQDQATVLRTGAQVAGILLASGAESIAAVADGEAGRDA